MMDLAALPWTYIVVACTVLVGLGIGWGMYRSSKTTPAEDRTSERGAQQIYKDDEKDGRG
jgi:hypothetical protein